MYTKKERQMRSVHKIKENRGDISYESVRSKITCNFKAAVKEAVQKQTLKTSMVEDGGDLWSPPSTVFVFYAVSGSPENNTIKEGIYSHE